MTASERIKIKKAILQALKDRGWTEIDLTLSEFGLPTFDERWQGNTESYILASLGEAGDDDLRSLARHLDVGADDSPSAERALPSFWAPGSFRLFVTHLAGHKKRATRLRDYLARFNISGFVAHEDIEPTAEWQTEIESALRTMDALTVIVTEGLRDSAWADQEIGFALGRGRLVVPLRVGADPYGFIGKHQAVLVADGDRVDSVAEKVFQALRRNELTRARMTAALASLFAGSRSFDAARRNMGYLEEAELLSQELMAAIRRAYDENSQVRECAGMDVRINALLNKHGFEGEMISEPPSDDDVPF